ncbi:[methyl-Co(III) methanol-specific corrinoid protein]:coenzyme M methyltransferase [Rhodoblastus acidophilus]|uniref:uroporphyrinogen decarboxylase family protein n=1 Tax=Rhodoblastus acidophilus TaxID=1074 RepID=UPI00222539EA|nr:uroporphyrinogen decarboxylase family protein [Rhodoblastus acidophilus]MCW2285438.1 [methyl-Co(III) methanol-specific corrinoid protein]:coenzyme M methyltransferase [Rhodoblastus acidophilus]MCW2334313.1 [methyl-Co(III) methanol-specific corrinoid protein]:coenzyme M methyltransferase [Rhodoblastus acidophilus]
MLDARTRLKKVLAHETVDRPPCICPGGMMNMVTHELMRRAGIFWPDAHRDVGQMARLAAAAFDAECFDNIGLPFCMTVEAEALGARVDLGSETVEPHVVGYPLRSVSEADLLPSFDPDAGRAGVVLRALALARREGVPVIGNLTGPMSLAGSLIEPGALYKALRRQPEAARRLLDRLCDDLLAFGLRQLQAGADVIAISDPSGTAEILGPDLFAAFEIPALNRIARGLRQNFPEAGLIVHICGHMRHAFPLLEALDCDAISFDAVVRLAEARHHLPDKALMGAVSTFALERGTPDKIAALTRHCLRAGVDIVAPACGMGNATPLATVRAMRDTVLAI